MSLFIKYTQYNDIQHNNTTNNIMRLSITTLSIKTLSITTFTIKTSSITIQHHISIIPTLSIMSFMPSAANGPIMPSVIMLNVVAPIDCPFVQAK
jgi:hypothetical protein